MASDTILSAIATQLRWLFTVLLFVFRRYISVRLANRIKLTDSFVYTTMGPKDFTQKVSDTNVEEGEGLSRGTQVAERKESSDGEDGELLSLLLLLSVT